MTADPRFTPEQVEHLQWWIEALRSDYYKQGQRRLKLHYGRNDDRYCCLGVACDIFGSMEHGFWDEYNYFHYDEQQSVHTYLPTIVRLYFGIRSSEEHILMRWNDGDTSFALIANYLERLLRTGIL
jgi:hypothetical protein